MGEWREQDRKKGQNKAETEKSALNERSVGRKGSTSRREKDVLKKKTTIHNKGPRGGRGDLTRSRREKWSGAHRKVLKKNEKTTDTNYQKVIS